MINGFLWPYLEKFNNNKKWTQPFLNLCYQLFEQYLSLQILQHTSTSVLSFTRSEILEPRTKFGHEWGEFRLHSTYIFSFVNSTWNHQKQVFWSYVWLKLIQFWYLLFFDGIYISSNSTLLQLNINNP